MIRQWVQIGYTDPYFNKKVISKKINCKDIASFVAEAKEILRSYARRIMSYRSYKQKKDCSITITYRNISGRTMLTLISAHDIDGYYPAALDKKIESFLP